ncbi:hypothetical protein [Novosphingobium sp. YAF33]|uniref:hypothetical protein n=1 Tax=Novosphingobium sp. YAF33 TaxID=3233082 RepID=UPI003F9AE01E
MRVKLLLVLFSSLFLISPRANARSGELATKQANKDVCSQSEPLNHCKGAGSGALFHAANAEVLSTIPSHMGRVIRDGFAKAGDAPPLMYVASDRACSLNRGLGDKGSQVPTSDNKCWLASFGALGADIRQWGVVMDGVASADLALSQALEWASANQGMLLAPGGQIAITGTKTIAFDRASLTCAGGAADGNTSDSSYGTQGTTFLLTSKTVQPFTLGRGVRIKNCNFYWPNQKGDAEIPIPYPPLFTEVTGRQMVNVDLDGIRIVNAYDFLSSSESDDVFGNIHITSTYGYCIRYCFNLSSNLETMTISGFVADVNLFQGRANTKDRFLAKWTAAHGAFMRIWGNGDGSKRSSKFEVQGVILNKSSVFGYRYGFLVEGNATFNEASLDALWDGVGTAFEIKAGACVANVRFTGTYFAYQWLAGGFDNAPVFNLEAPAADCTAGVDISGQLAQAQGDFLVVKGSGWKAISINNLSGPGTYGRSYKKQSYHWIKATETPNLKISVIGNLIEPAKVGENYKGIFISSSLSSVIMGNSFNAAYNPIDVTGNTGAVAVFGNVSTQTSSSHSVVGYNNIGLIRNGNAFDR